MMGIVAANTATSGVTLLCVSAGAVVALGWGAIRVSQGELDLRTLAIVLMLGVEVFRPIRELTTLYHKGMVAMSAADGIFAILDSVPEVTDKAIRRGGEGATGRGGAPAVELEHVTVAYPRRGNPPGGLT